MSFWLKAGAAAAMAIFAWAAYRSTTAEPSAAWLPSGAMGGRASTGEPSRRWPGAAREASSPVKPADSAAYPPSAGGTRAPLKTSSLGEAEAAIAGTARPAAGADRQTDSLARSAAFQPAPATPPQASLRTKTAANYNQMSRKDIMGRALGPVKNAGSVEAAGEPGAEIQTLGFESGSPAPARTAGGTPAGPIGSDAQGAEIDGTGITYLQERAKALLKRGNEVLKRARGTSKVPQKGSPKDRQ